jgi:hypothetical protein
VGDWRDETGNTEADGVKTCVRIPRGTAVASRGGGTVGSGKACWLVPALGAGKKKSYSVSFRTLRSTRGKIKAGVSASASNAPSASDSGANSGTVRVLPVRKPKPQPPIG